MHVWLAITLRSPPKKYHTTCGEQDSSLTTLQSHYTYIAYAQTLTMWDGTRIQIHCEHMQGIIHEVLP